MKIDLDAARAARREAAGEGPSVVFNSVELQLPAELPFDVAERLSTLDEEQLKTNPAAVASGLGVILRSLLGEKYDEFMASKPSFDDLMVLVEGLVKAYGLDDLGESPASADS